MAFPADVAVKIMPTSVIRTAIKEVLALTRLNHSYIVQLLSVQAPRFTASPTNTLFPFTAHLPPPSTLFPALPHGPP